MSFKEVAQEFPTSLLLYCVIFHCCQRWMWHHQLFQGGGLGIPISLHYTMPSRRKAEVASQHLSKGWVRHPISIYYIILYHTTLYSPSLYCTILYYTTYHTIPYYTILYQHDIPYPTILYHTIPYYTILYHTILYYAMFSLQRWRWHPHLFQQSGFGIPISLYLFFFAEIEMASLSLSRKWVRHPHLTFNLLHYTRVCFAKTQVASPSFSRSWARHPHLSTIYFALAYKGGGCILTSFKTGCAEMGVASPSL